MRYDFTEKRFTNTEHPKDFLVYLCKEHLVSFEPFKEKLDQREFWKEHFKLCKQFFDIIIDDGIVNDNAIVNPVLKNVKTARQFLFVLCQSAHGNFAEFKQRDTISSTDYWDIWESLKTLCRGYFNIDIDNFLLERTPDTLWILFVTAKDQEFPNFYPIGLFTTKEKAIEQLKTLPIASFLKTGFSYQIKEAPVNELFSWLDETGIPRMRYLNHSHFENEDDYERI